MIMPKNWENIHKPMVKFNYNHLEVHCEMMLMFMKLKQNNKMLFKLFKDFQ